MNEKIFFKVSQIIEEIFDVPFSDILPETELNEDLGADEFDLVELSMIIEEEFDVVLDEKQLKSVVTIDDLCTLIENR